MALLGLFSTTFFSQITLLSFSKDIENILKNTS